MDALDREIRDSRDSGAMPDLLPFWPSIVVITGHNYDRAKPGATELLKELGDR